MKKKNFLFVFVLLAFVIFPIQGKAQCKEFTETQVLPLLEDYVISGRYSAVKLYEGEEILIFKTLSKGISYRFIVKGDSELPEQIEYSIEDWDGEKLYNNKSDEFKQVWDYECDKTQRIKIFVKVPAVSKDNTESKRGCVTILSGIKAS